MNLQNIVNSAKLLASSPSSILFGVVFIIGLSMLGGVVALTIGTSLWLYIQASTDPDTHDRQVIEGLSSLIGVSFALLGVLWHLENWWPVFLLVGVSHTFYRTLVKDIFKSVIESNIETAYKKGLNKPTPHMGTPSYATWIMITWIVKNVQRSREVIRLIDDPNFSDNKLYQWMGDEYIKASGGYDAKDYDSSLINLMYTMFIDQVDFGYVIKYVKEVNKSVPGL